MANKKGDTTRIQAVPEINVQIWDVIL